MASACMMVTLSFANAQMDTMSMADDKSRGTCSPEYHPCDPKASGTGKGTCCHPPHKKQHKCTYITTVEKNGKKVMVHLCKAAK